MEVLGFKDSLTILLEERNRIEKRNDHLNQIAGLDEMGFNEKFFVDHDIQDQAELISPMLGTT